jgi:hypothetical protein
MVDHDEPRPAVVDTPESIWPIANTDPMGPVAHDKALTGTFQLVTSKIQLVRRPISLGRMFVALGAAARELCGWPSPTSKSP